MELNGGATGGGSVAGAVGGGGAAHHILSQSTSLPVMPSHIPLHLQNQNMNQNLPEPSARSGPHLRIVEEPTSNIIRFRYKCEGRTAGSIPGMNSSSETGKTFPTIEVCNYDGPVIIVVSCVTSDEPFRQHPHWLVSKEEADACKSGIYQRNCRQRSGGWCFKKWAYSAPRSWRCATRWWRGKGETSIPSMVSHLINTLLKDVKTI